ncbi:ABC transporter permease [Persicitalea jodogahamensis]|uniref:ABC transporter permease n=1 Tax=Persicitalea jodogahamensis TaxID=402147 RepID=A0A8J3GB86_9BACT|nr:ABC transporter permease [Persicitalea jodogahamensis]GHB80059.1 ABC transporter permease [Persicitalea jodogahamensis]
MLRHLLKLIWNKKGSHSLLIIEIWASFMVLFGVLSLIVYNLNNYLEPIGFEYKNVWVVDLNNNQDTTAIAEKTTQIMQRIRSYPQVASASRMSSNTPFSANTMNNSTNYQKISSMADDYYTDEEFSKTLDLPLTAGRWYLPEDRVSKSTPVVINKKLQEKLFGDENPLGKVLGNNDSESEGNQKTTFRVVGVVDKFKAKGEFMLDNPAIFKLMDKNDKWNKLVLIKTKAGTDATFEERLVKDIAAMAPGWGIEVSYLTESRKNRHNLTLVPVIIFLIISGFLLTNVALGLFGILNLGIARRRSEIGLRRAMGATEGSVTAQFLGEMWVLAAFSVILGLLFAVQFPIMNVFDIAAGVYLTAIAAAIVVIFVIVTLCAWYPSRQAARVQPALALHEE